MATTWIERLCRTTLLLSVFVSLTDAIKGYESVLKSNPDGCSAVKYAYEAKGYRREDVPTEMITGRVQYSASVRQSASQ